MTHQPGVYVPLRALFLVNSVFQAGALVHIYHDGSVLLTLFSRLVL